MDPLLTLLCRCTLVWLSLNLVYCKNGYDLVYPEQFSAEGVLITHLMAGYEKRGRYGRPILNFSEALMVSQKITLIQIVDLEEKNQVLKLNLWTEYSWTDQFLKWNPDDHDGVDELRLPSDKIWLPDIKLYNYADTRLEERREALAIINYKGTVVWIPQGIYMSTCDIDVTTFPFDKQKCHLKFGSWTYDKSKLDLQFLGPEKMITEDASFVENKAWSLIMAPGKKNTKKYNCCPEVYIDLSYQITFRRSATFYTYILILPCVLLTSLTLVLYWIPPESPTKMALGMSIFMALFVLLVLFEKNMPPASTNVPILGMSIFMAFFVLLLLFEGNMPPASTNVPILGTYYCLNMILITTSTFLNVFVVNLSFYGARAPLPKGLKKVMFQFFARAMCMDNLVRPFLEADKKRLIPPAIPGMGFVNGDSGKWPKNWKGSSELLVRRKDEFEADPQLAEIDLKLTEIREFLNFYRERLDEKDRKMKIAMEWKALGLIFDRIFFWIYLVTIMVSLTVVLSVIFMSS